MILYGAAPMSPSRLAEGLDRFGPAFAQMFGQTECYPISFLRTGDHRVDEPDLLASCGVPVAGADVSIRGEADDRGYLYIVDRKKDMIVSGGFNVFSRGVEDALTTHPAVASAAVYGTPDPRWGESVTATVVLRSGADVAVDELTAHVRAAKGSLHTPKRIAFADKLPLTSLGKIDKRRLRADWETDNTTR